MSNTPTAARAENFISSIGINVHMNYTDGAYANVANVVNDLAYLGITNVRDGLATNTALIPIQNQLSAFKTMASDGIKFDLGMTSTNVQVDIAALNAMEKADPGSILATEGPNEINNWPITYNGLTGLAAATAFQTASYAAIKADPALSGVSVFGFTGAPPPILTPSGTLTQNNNGSYTLVRGITGWAAVLPVGVTTIKINYTGGTPYAGLFTVAPGQGQVGTSGIGANGVMTFTYDNTGKSPLQAYVSVGDWFGTTTITGVSAVSGSSGNLVAFDPNLTGAGTSDYLNYHPYPSNGNQPGGYITSAITPKVANLTTAPTVLTEDGYNTDHAASSGVSPLAQAQGEVKILLDAYKDGVSQTYLYELLDEKPDPTDSSSEMHFGVFNNDNTAKPAALAIHDLTTVLADIGSNANSFTPGTLNYSVSNLPSTANKMLLAKSNGSFDLAIWDEPASTTAGAKNITVNLGATYQTVEVYDPVTGAAAVESLSNVSQVTLSLGNDPLIVEVEPAGYVNIATQTPKQVAALSSTQIAALTFEQISSLTAADVAAMTKSQIGALTGPEVTSLSAAQLDAISVTALAGLGTADIADISASNLATLTVAQMKALGSAQLTSLTITQVAGLAPTAIASINATAIAGLSHADVAALSTAQAVALTPGQIAQLTTAQIAALAPAALTKFSQTQFAAITPADIRAITPAQFLAISVSDIAALTTQQMAALMPSQLAEFSKTQIASLSLPDIAKMSAAQAAALSAGQIVSFTIAQVKNLSTAALHGFTPAEAHAFTAHQLAALSTPQHSALV